MNARTDFIIGSALGVHHGLPIGDYHSSPGISNSGLGDFARSPAHYYAFHLDPNRPPEEETPAQLVGNLAHCAILEPLEFTKRYAVGPCNDKRLKAWKEWEAAQLPEEEDGAAKLIRPSQAEVAWRQARSVVRIADVAALLASGNPEVSAYWIDPATGELCRCRPDWCHPVGSDKVILCDLKTTGSAAPNEFVKQAQRLRYANQSAWYSDGFELASGKKVVGFVFIVVECEWPYAAAAYMLPDEWLAIARQENEELLARFAECRASDKWPGYAESVQLLDMPRWLTQ